MGDLVGHGVTEALFEIFRKQPGVVANASDLRPYLIHAGALALEIKVHGYGVKLALIQPAQAFQYSVAVAASTWRI